VSTLHLPLLHRLLQVRDVVVRLHLLAIDPDPDHHHLDEVPAKTAVKLHLLALATTVEAHLLVVSETTSRDRFILLFPRTAPRPAFPHSSLLQGEGEK
jgi:hypothetical protein